MIESVQYIELGRGERPDNARELRVESYAGGVVPRKGETVRIDGKWYDVWWVQHDLDDNELNVCLEAADE